MNKGPSKHVKILVENIIENIDDFLPATYVPYVISIMRQENHHSNLNDKQLKHIIRLVRIGRRFDLPIARALEKLAMDYCEEQGITLDPTESKFNVNAKTLDLG